ncbi:MAG TPA: F0F1 ATP synthase subunit A [Fimbriimonadaceae bacterium]|nr:F0F1 ATP synthase subunit A [Fimbriimonadaceae bacterium]
MNQHLYNLMPTLAAAGGEHHGASYWGLLVHIGIVLILMFLTMSWAKKGFGERVFKNKWSQRFEQVYLFIENMCVGTIGPHGRKYVPFILTFWLVIFFGNVVALFFATAPTADLGFNLGMALVAIGYVQYEGIKTNGLFGHLSHFAGPKLGLALIPISAMIFIIEVISELMKNVSLSLRLYGNMNGGHQAVEAMNLLGGDYIPVGGFLILIKLLTVVVQAMIFTLLTCVYLSLVTHHEEEHAHEGDHALAHAH